MDQVKILLKTLYKCDEWFSKHNPTAVLPGHLGDTAPNHIRWIIDQVKIEQERLERREIRKEFEKEEKPWRYFFIGVAYKPIHGSIGTSNLSVRTHRMPNQKEIKTLVAKEIPDGENFTIIGFSELTEEAHAALFPEKHRLEV